MFRLMLGCGLGWMLAVSAWGQDGKKLAVPTQADQARATALVTELYDLPKVKASKDAAAVSRAAQLLLAEGRETNDDPAGRYVLLLQAHSFAAQAGDVPTAIQALEEVDRHFTFDTKTLYSMKLDALKVAARSAAGPELHQIVVDTALVLLDESLARDDFSASRTLLEAADQSAFKLKNVGLVVSIRRRLDDLTGLEKEFARWKPFADRLAENPKDAEANLEMGKYHALVKGNWALGLPLLAKGQGPMADLAKVEAMLRPEEILAGELPQRWRKLSNTAATGQRIQILKHAYHLYLRALPVVVGPARQTVAGQMREIMNELPPEDRVGEVAVELRKLENPLGPVHGCAISADGRRIAGTGTEGTIRIWDARTGKEIRRLAGHSGRVWSLAFTPDGRRLVSGGFDNTIRVWDLLSGQELRRLSGHTDYVRCVAINASGTQILSSSDDRTVRLWDVESGKGLRTLSGHNHFVWSVAFSADGTQGVSASLDKTARVWNLADGKLVKILTGHGDTVLAATFTPDGTHVITGSTDKTLRLWNLETGAVVRTFQGHTGYVHAVAATPDGRRVLSASQDHSVRLWDVESGQEIRDLPGHRDQVWSVHFSADGRFAVTSGQDQTVRVWGNTR